MTGSGKIEVVGHRGAAAYARDNTEPSFRLALELGVDMIETDLRVTSDGVLVLVHDEAIVLPGGKRRPIERLSFAEIWREMPDLLTLDDLVEIVPRGFPLMLDIKRPGYEPEIIAAIRRHGLESSVVAPSTWATTLRRLHAALPRLRTGLSTGHLAGGDPHHHGRRLARRSMQVGFPSAIGLLLRTTGATDVMLHHRVASERLVRAVRRTGRSVNLWTVDQLQDIERAVALEPDRIITNVPDRVINALRALAPDADR